MGILEVLIDGKFTEAVRYLDTTMINNAGKELVVKMERTMGNSEEAIMWFYSPQRALGEKTPYEFCLDEKKQDVEDLLGRIEEGVYS